MEIGHRERSLEQRQSDCKKVQDKYPDKVCVYIEKSKSCKTVPDIDKHKFLVPNIISVSQFIYVIRKRVKLSPDEGLFFFVNNNTIISGNTSLGTINERHKDEDGFLYITYSGENCFGSFRRRSRVGPYLNRYPLSIREQANNLGVTDDIYAIFASMQGRDIQPNDYDTLLRLHVNETKKTLNPLIIDGFSTIPSSQTDEICSICLTAMNEEKDKLLLRLPCKAGHIFHTLCIREWLTTASTCCPLDNEDLCKSMDA